MSVKFRSRRREVVEQFKGRVADNVQDAGKLFLTELQKMLRGQRTGKLYIVPGGTKRQYTASAPGEPPARRTGRLVGSFQVVPTGRYRILVGSPLVYARHLEVGTSRMAPRPYFRRTLRENRRRLQSILSRETV